MSTQNQGVPLLNLSRQYQQIGQDLENAVLGVLRSGSYILGEKGKSLEAQIAEICGCQFGIGVANGTDALVLALWALDLGPGDEVITSSFTFAATVEAIAINGAKPVFVDIDPLTYNIDPDLIERAITPATKAILPVHLYGQPANMPEICAIAKKHGLKVIEDNAQAIGATFNGQPTGSFGDLACISFYPTKNLGAAGDAGAIVTNNPTLAERLRAIRQHGMRVRYYHDELGVNSRLDEIQAAVLLTKLPHLRKWTHNRQEIARQYTNLLKSVKELSTPFTAAESEHVWHQYTIRVNDSANLPVESNAPGAKRDYVKAQLEKRGIGSMCYYPIPLHLQKAFAEYGYKPGSLPITEQVALEVISLPMYPELNDQEVKTVASALESIFNEAKGITLNTAITING
jgi:dTDP-4-amino-4,6-dideoxygalactose transaminase